MDLFVEIGACVGAWLLVAGPLLQASNELWQIARHADTSEVKMPSVWWWLLPPVMYLIGRHRLGKHDEDERWRNLRRTATGWYLVATGAALIALKETWTLGESLGWSTGIRLLVFLITALLMWSSTSTRMIIQSYQERALRERAEREGR